MSKKEPVKVEYYKGGKVRAYMVDQLVQMTLMPQPVD